LPNPGFFGGGGSVTGSPPLPDEPLPDEPLPLLDEPLLDELLPEFDEPLCELEEPLPLLPLVEVPEPLVDDPLLELDEPLLEFDDPLPDPDEPLPLLPPVLAAEGGRPLSSVSVSSQLMLGLIEIASWRVPALITKDCTEAVANVALEPSTVASIDVRLLTSDTVIAFVSPAIPLQVSTPSTSVGVTLIMIRSSSASNPWKCAEGLMNLRARCGWLPRALRLKPNKIWFCTRARNPPVRFSRPIGSPIQRQRQ
jgi:hypothetical protein